MVSLGQQRKDIDVKVKIEIQKFQDELNEVKLNIDSFREKFSAKGYSDYVNTIDHINEQLKMLTNWKKSINKKQEDLEFHQDDFPVLE